MHKIYTLSTCDTSKRILKPIPLGGFVVKDIKKENITVDELNEMKEMAGSFENLFSRRSRSYISLELKDKNLSEEEYEKYILSDYTFLKRPVVIVEDEIFIGNQKKNVEALYKKLNINE